LTAVEVADIRTDSQQKVAPSELHCLPVSDSSMET
jgi:hypothetical protein